MASVYDICDRYVERFAALNPIAATSMGVPGYDAEIGDFSPAGADRNVELARATIAELDAAPLDGEGDRIAREALAGRLRIEIELHEAGEHLRALNILASPLQRVRGTFDLMSRDDEQAWANVASRLSKVPGALDGYRERLNAGIERGLVSSARQTREVATQTEVWSGRGEDQEPYFASLLAAHDDAGSPGGASLRRDLERAAQQATDAYAEIGRWLTERYLPHADPHDPVGRDRYRLGVGQFNGVDLDLDETYEWGWEEVHRIDRELAETAERIAPGEGVDAAVRRLDEDPERVVDGVDEFQRWMQELQDSTIAELDGKHFDIPEPVRRIEALIAPPGGALAMYYTGPSEDFSRPGRTWYPTAGRTRFPTWKEASIAYHEGVPGHHLQIATTRYLAAELSRAQRLNLTGTSGYVEGWALYAERLMHELGYLDDPAVYLGLLTSQALRCARVVVDIGMHLELRIPAGDSFHPGETWTPELAYDFLVERSRWPEDFLASEVTRYLGLPGQAISYKVGERMWREAREHARSREGASFDLKAWHARALSLGPMGLAQMQRELGS